MRGPQTHWSPPGRHRLPREHSITHQSEEGHKPAERQQVTAQVLEPCTPVGTWREFRVPGFSWPNPDS